VAIKTGYVYAVITSTFRSKNLLYSLLWSLVFLVFYPCNEELGDLYSLPNIVRLVKSRRMRWAEHLMRMEEGRDVHRVLVGKPEGKKPLGKPRRRWEDNIKTHLQKVGGGCGDWMELAQDRDKWLALVTKVLNFRVP
jgi:hypothetical protein